MNLSADLQPDQITAVVDTREQLPLDLSPLKTEAGTLATGDYSVKGLEHVVSIERKSLVDLLGCMAGGRERFERELQRMLAYPVRAVLVEAEWRDLQEGGWTSRVTPTSATGSVLGWIASGIPFVFCGDHANAGKIAARLLFIAARRRWREARGLVGAVLQESGVPA